MTMDFPPESSSRIEPTDRDEASTCCTPCETSRAQKPRRIKIKIKSGFA